MTITFDGSDQPNETPAPVTWVLAMDPRFPDFARRWKAERGTVAFRNRSKWVPGDKAGWFFPAHWVDAAYRSPGR